MRITFITLFSFFLIFSIFASEQLNPSGIPGSVYTNSPTLNTFDFINNQIMENGKIQTSKLNNNLGVDEKGYSEKLSPQPLSKTLKQLNKNERENAEIFIELNNDATDNEIILIKNIENMWNTGSFNSAINELEIFEESNVYKISGIGISWKQPRVVYGTDGVDVQIGTVTGVYQTDIDVDVNNGHLLASLLYDNGVDRGWTINISTDGGATWLETFLWNSGSVRLNDVDGAIVGGYFWVSYVNNTVTQDNARMRRFNSSDGSVDAVYGWHSVFDLNLEIKELCVFSNADNTNNRIYLTAITEDGLLRFYWDDMIGTSFTSINTGITSVDHGLDGTWNFDATNNNYWILSYVNTNGILYGVVGDASTWNNYNLAQASIDTNHVTSVAAWKDTLMIVYQDTGSIKYRVSYNAGSNWSWGYIANGSTFQNPHITGRLDGGFGVVYTEEAGVFDPVYYRHRTYEYGTGFTTPDTINDADCYSYGYTNIEWIPPVTANYAYGATWIFGSNSVNFDRIEEIPQPDPPDISVSPSFFDFAVPENGTDTQILTIFNNAAAGAEDLIWNIGDQSTKLELKNGTKIPVKIQWNNNSAISKEIKYTNKHEIGPPPSSQTFNTSAKNVPFHGEILYPTDYGFGPEYNNNAMGEFILNDPANINLLGTYPAALYAAAEFGNTGDFSFMYCLDYHGNMFVRIDMATGVVDTIAVATPYSGESWAGLAMDPVSGTMFASSTSVNGSSIYTIDLISGALNRIGEVTNSSGLIAIAIDNSGQMYGHDIVSDSLISINKSTAAGTQIGPLGFDANFAQGMDFDETDGTLYLAAYNNSVGPELRIADTATGATTLVGPLGTTTPGNAFLGGFGVATKADCPWLTELPTNGTIAPGNSQVVDITVDATGLAIGTYNCNLIVSSNDPDEPQVVIPVQLEVIGNPVIVVSPTSVTETVSFGDSVLVPIQIENTGNVELHWNARATNHKNLRSNPYFTAEQLNNFSGLLKEQGAIDKAKINNNPVNVELIKGKSKWFSTEQVVLWDNGPLVNSPGSGAGGADESVLQNISLSMSTLGFGHQVSANNRIADDFVVTGDNWTADYVTFFAYQTGTDTNSTITGVNYRVWDGPPEQPGSNVVFGDTSTNRMIATGWSGIYRVTETTSGATNRPIMMNIVSGGFSLPPGRYWLDWQSDGSAASGPWAPPITVTGMDSTGDAWQYTSAWAPVIDGGSMARQGFPFVIEGTADNLWMKMVGPVSGILTPGNHHNLDMRLFGVFPDSLMIGEITITSNDVSQPVITIPIDLTILPPNSVNPLNAGLITKYELLQNYPNPFNPSTTIKYRLANRSPQLTTLKIFNNLGQLVRTLVNSEQNNGEYTIVWDGLDNNNRQVSSGLYYYKLKSGNFVSSQKLLKLK